MSHIASLKNASSLHDVAAILGYKPASLSYILYKMPPQLKYREFDIPKRGGGKRKIAAPNPQLRSLQRHLANVLYGCWEEIEAKHPKRKPLAHGFSRDRSILTNAHPHKGRRFVLNVDLEDFFPSINFGRVRAFFIHDHEFGLVPKVATVLAQVACHDNALPQGSPCSPIISNLVGHILDARLVGFAKAHGCTYTRYADDITLSTNNKTFPKAVAVAKGDDWKLGKKLVSKIEGAGFAINSKKTRMQCRPGRQLVTGLTVNRKVNIRADYYRYARAMCYSLFQKGSIHSPQNHSIGKVENGVQPLSSTQLGGILSHIYAVKDASDRRADADKKKNPTAIRTLYRLFLFHQTFVDLPKPLLVCEGKTDNTYLKLAIKSRAAKFPLLGKLVGTEFHFGVSFFGYGKGKRTDGKAKRDILQLMGGTGDLKFLVIDYGRLLAKFKFAPMQAPVVIVVDNDSGAKHVFDAARSVFQKKIELTSTAQFYHIHANLYLVKTVEGAGAGESCIEDCFDKPTLAMTLDGKTFNPKKPLGSANEISKSVFAEKLVRPNADKISFAGFDTLLARIEAALHDHKSKSLALAAATPVP